MVNTNGFTASTFDIGNQDFMNGGALTFLRGEGAGSIVNNGSIVTGTGGAHLIAGDIANHGTIQSNGGNITLASGGSVTLDNGVTYVQPSMATLESGISPTAGLIQNTGTIRATGAATSGGEVYLVNPNGKILHDGTIAAHRSGTRQEFRTADDSENESLDDFRYGTTVGGHVQMEADHIKLTTNSSIDATGTHGGGDVLVGGDWQGSGDITHATTVTVDAGATIDASATETGDGGTIVLWSDIFNSDSITSVAGTLLAQAGDLLGNGGQIETSGHDLNIESTVTVDAGRGGHWLLDPYNIVISALGGDVTGTSIEASLNAGTSVTLDTSTQTVGAEAGDIFVQDEIDSTGTGSLTLKADRDIFVGEHMVRLTGDGANLSLLAKRNVHDETAAGNIHLETGTGNLLLSSDTDGSGGGTIDLRTSGTIDLLTGGGDITLGGGNELGTGYAQGYNASTSEALILDAGVSTTLDSNGGDISLRGRSATATAANGHGAEGIAIRGGTTIDSGTGGIHIEGIGQQSGTSDSNGQGVYFYGGGDTTITSAKVASDAIVIVGDASASDSTKSFGIDFASNMSIHATGDGGGILLDAHAGAEATDMMFRTGTHDVLASSGPITLQGNKATGYLELEANTDLTLGSKSGTPVPTSAADLTIQFDQYWFNDNRPDIATSGSVTWQSFGTAFGQNVDTDWFSWNTDAAQKIGGLTIGKSTNTGNVTFNSGDLGSLASGLTVGGGVTAYGGIITVANDLTSTGTGDIFLQALATTNPAINIAANISKTGGDVSTFTAKSASRIQLSSGITATNPGGMNVVLWSDYDGGDQGGVSIGGNVNTGGGHFWAGGSDVVAGSDTWNGLTVGNGPSVGQLNYNHNAMDLYADISTSGGDVLLWGGDGYSSGIDGIGVIGDRIISSGAGAITLIGDDINTGTITVNSTGHFTYQPNGNAWSSYGGQFDYTGTISGNTFTGAGDADWLKINDYNTLGGLTLGKIGNTTGIQVYQAVDVNGPINLYGGFINVNGNLTSLLAGAGVLLRSTGNISTDPSRRLQTNGGDITLWSDSDSSGQGYILVGQDSTLDSRTAADRTAGTHTIGGGKITLGGGTDDGSGSPSGYAIAVGADTTRAGINLGSTANSANTTNIYSGGGDVSMKGQSDSDTMGVMWLDGGTLDAGNTGRVNIEGVNTSTGHGVEIGAYNQGSSTIIRASGGSESVAAVKITGSTATTGGNLGVQLQKLTVQSLGSGRIDITGSTSGSGYGVGLYTANLLSANGSINVGGETAGITLDNTTIGQKAATPVTTSSSDINLTGDRLIVSGTNVVDTSGVLTVQPFSTSFSSTLNWPMSGLGTTSQLGGLTLGKSGNTADISINSAQNVDGVIQVYGGTLAINDDLISAATSGTGVLLHGSEIVQAAGVAVSTDGANIEYVAAGAPVTAGHDYAVSFVGTSGSKATVDAAGGDISISGSYGTTGVSGGSDRAIRISEAELKTSGSGTISMVGDATNNTSEVNVWGFQASDSIIQTESGAINLTMTGGKASANSRGMAIENSGFKILSESGAITLRDLAPVGLTGTYNGLYLRPSSSTDITIGADGATVATSSSDILIQSDRVFFDINGSFGNTINTSGNLVIESTADSFAGSPSLAGLNISGTPASLRIGKAGNVTGFTLSKNITTAGDQTYNGPVTLSGDSSFTSSNSIIEFANTVDSDSTARSLSVNAGSTGELTFNGGVGGGNALASLNITAGGGIQLNGGVVNSLGSQLYNSPVLLGADTHVSTIQSNIIFGSTVDSNSASTPWNLTATITPGNTYYWVDWIDWNPTNKTVTGTISVGSDVITVTYHNPQGIFGAQTNGGTNYWTGYNGAAFAGASPYVSSKVANGPTGSDIIQLEHAGQQTLSFSQSVENLAFNVVSLNGNGYGFDQDFTIESYSGFNGAGPGYFGSGDLVKTNVGNTFQLNDGGANGSSQSGYSEPHGTVRFGNAFSTLTWNSLSDETWNGFTVGISGTSNTAGSVQFNGAVGATTGLGAINVNGALQTTAAIANAASLNVTGLANLGGDITTSGNQGFGSAITIGSDLALTITDNGSIQAGSTIDGNHHLTVETDSAGNVTLKGAVGSKDALSDIDITTNELAAGDLTLAANGALEVDVSGDSTIGGTIAGSDVTLAKAGSGTLTLPGTNTYTGATKINAGTLNFLNDAPMTTSSGFQGLGSLTIQSVADSFSSAFNTSDFASSTGTSLGGLTIGKSTNTADVTIGSALIVDGDININGGNVAINSALTSQNSNTVSIHATGTVVDGASGYLSTDKLLVKASGATTLDSTSNAIGTFAFDGTSLKLVESNGFTIGSVGSTDGVTATGTINIATLAGDLTILQNVATTDATATAIVINAGQTAAAKTATGGNLIVSGSPTITVGSGGMATLMTGSVAGSTGLTDLIGSGSERFRYGSDEVATNFVKALVAGVNAIYREQPTIGGSIGDKSQTYGDSLATLTGSLTGIVNGDTLDQVFDGGVTVTGTESTSGHNVVGTHSINVGAEQLGYSSGTITGGTLTVTAKAITTPLVVDNKTYDGTTDASFTASANGVETGDLVSIGGTATFADKNVAVGKTVSVSGLSISGTDAANYSLGSTSGTSTADITAKSITVSGIAGVERVYDGSTAITLDASGTVFTGMVQGDNVNVTSATGTLDDKHAGAAKSVTIATTNYGGSDVGNYAITDQTATTANVTAKSISVSGIAANDKTYDGNRDAIVGLGGVTFNGMISGDDLTAAGTIGAFADKNAGSNKTVNLTGTTYGGSDAGNYAITDQATATASIAQKSLIVSGIIAADKTYDATTTATVDGSSVNFGGLVFGDTLSIDTLTGTFADKNAAAGKTVNLATTYTGADVGNYAITNQATSTAAITPSSVSVSGLTANNKVYDATTALTLSGTATVTAIAADDLQVTGSAIANFDNKNVGTSKAIVVSGLTLSGDDANNYSINQPAGLTADITPAPLTVTANNDAKFVTKTDAVGYAGASYSGFVAGEGTSDLTGSLAITRSGMGTDESADNYANALAAGGWSSDNYDITFATGDYTIVPADQLLVRFDNSTSTYGDLLGLQLLSAKYMDSGNTVHTLAAPSVVDGRYVFDDGSGGSAAFDVVLDGSSLSTSNHTNVGAFSLGMENVDITSGNFSNSVEIVGNHAVTRTAIDVGASGVSKTYDGNKSMVNLTLDQTGDITGDSFTLNGQGSYADRHAGTSLNYTVGNLELSGTDANNYYLSGGSTFSAADGAITPKNVTITAPTATKVYDGNTHYVATAPQLQAITDALGIAGDSVASITLTYDDKNVGSDKTLTASNISINDGNGGGNYNITFADDTSSSITRLGTVTWIGGTTGNWNDPANWAGGAVPDLANVANVVIPQGVTPTFDNTVNGPVEIDSLLGGSLQVDSGTLNVDGSLDVDTFTQDGGTVTAGTFNADDFAQNDGTLEVDDTFTVNNRFTQSTTGTIHVNGDVDITQTTGDLTVNQLSGDNVKLDSKTGDVNLEDLATHGNLDIDAAGDVTQISTGTIIVGETTTINAGDNIELGGFNNNFVGPVNATGHNIRLFDAHDGLTLGNIDASGNLNTASADGDLTQSEGTTIQVDGDTIVAAIGDVILDNPGNVFTGIVYMLADNGTIRQSAGDLLLGHAETIGDLTVTVENGSLGQTPTSTIEVGGNSSFTARTEIDLMNSGNRLGEQTTVDAPLYKLHSIDPLNIVRTGAALADSTMSESISQTTNDTFTRPASASQTDSQSGEHSGQSNGGWFEKFKMFVADLVSRGSVNSVNGQTAGLNAEQTGDETYLRPQGPT
nr:YDG domain-containing protein [Rubripirellula lacrimiformis]